MTEKPMLARYFVEASFVLPKAWCVVDRFTGCAVSCDYDRGKVEDTARIMNLDYTLTQGDGACPKCS